MIRSEFVEKHFLNIKLSKETMDVYVPRIAIQSAITKCAPLLEGVLLDVGCGQMPYRERILALNRNITRYIGLDLQNSSIHNSGVADIFWDGITIPLENDSIDSAMATEVLEHSFHPVATLQEINRVLKPGGCLLFTVPFIWPLHETPYDAGRYTPFSLKMYLEEASFDDIQIQSLGGWHASLAQMLGLWAAESPLQNFRKKLAATFVCKLIPYLLKSDVKDDRFGQHCMISGLYGTAKKRFI